jgi:hypothetical protein
MFSEVNKMQEIQVQQIEALQNQTLILRNTVDLLSMERSKERADQVLLDGGRRTPGAGSCGARPVTKGAVFGQNQLHTEKNLNGNDCIIANQVDCSNNKTFYVKNGDGQYLSANRVYRGESGSLITVRWGREWEEWKFSKNSQNKFTLQSYWNTNLIGGDQISHDKTQSPKSLWIIESPQQGRFLLKNAENQKYLGLVNGQYRYVSSFTSQDYWYIIPK